MDRKQIRSSQMLENLFKFNPAKMRVSDYPYFWFQYREILLTATLFLAAVGLYSLDWFYGLKGGGVSTVGAERVLHGEIPYRDFWTVYAPGHFYVLALLFRIFGTHLLVEVVAASIVSAAAACVCYWLILNLVGRRLAALVCAGVFVAATYNTGYFRTFGTYPGTILFVFTALIFAVFYYKTNKVAHLVLAGLATGTAVAFKHDVGGYTAIAILAGLLTHHLLTIRMTTGQLRSLLLRMFAYSAGVVLIVLPLTIYFAILAGPDMLQDLIVFPLTDFPFARPESYPSLLPFTIYDESRLIMLYKFFRYFIFAVPFGLFLVGLVASGLAIVRRKPAYVAASVTFSVGYLLHYSAAHVQINTHIITMSVYSIWLGVIFYDLVEAGFSIVRPSFIRLLTLTLIAGWLLSLMAQPAFIAWQMRQRPIVDLKLAKVSGVMVPQREAQTLMELSAFVNAHLRPDQKVFVGLHRHDVVIIGDTRIYFILNRPNATRYQELHPGIVDTAPVQQEIIADLQSQNVSLIVLKRIFSDEHLDRVKQDFLKNLPHVGATELDEFIGKNYGMVRDYDPYTVWLRKEK